MNFSSNLPEIETLFLVYVGFLKRENISKNFYLEINTKGFFLLRSSFCFKMDSFLKGIIKFENHNSKLIKITLLNNLIRAKTLIWPSFEKCVEPVHQNAYQ